MNRLESFESLLSDPTNVHILDTTFISLIHKPGLREEEKMCLDLKEIGGIDVQTSSCRHTTQYTITLPHFDLKWMKPHCNHSLVSVRLYRPTSSVAPSSPPSYHPYPSSHCHCRSPVCEAPLPQLPSSLGRFLGPTLLPCPCCHVVVVSPYSSSSLLSCACTGSLQQQDESLNDHSFFHVFLFSPLLLLYCYKRACNNVIIVLL